MEHIALIVAHDLNRGIGKNNDLVWHCPEDMAYFKSVTSTTDNATKKNMLLMGRKTWDSIPAKFKPLPNRINMVLTRDKQANFHPDVITINSVEEAISIYKKQYDQGLVEQLFCIGGSQLYNTMIRHPKVNNLYITLIHSEYDVDCYFPPYENQFDLLESGKVLHSKSCEYQFFKYSKSNK